MTYLQLVNNVLQRLREDPVSSVSITPYSKLIGSFVNDAKRDVEDAWRWEALRKEIDITTVAGTSTYVVTGAGTRHRDAVFNNTTRKHELTNRPLQWIKNQQQLTIVQNGSPFYYAWNGSNGTDSVVELYPTPNGVYTIIANLYVPQANLSADSDVLLVPSDPVIMGAYARAIVERGEDGGLHSSEVYAMFRGVLADQVAMEAARQTENDCWVAV